MEQCSRCLKFEDEVHLIDAIDNNEVVKICEDCLLTEDLPVVRKPNIYQLKEMEKPYTVYQRLSRMAGMPKDVVKKKEEEKIARGITLDKLRKPRDYSQIVRKKAQPISLVDNYHWIIQRIRRKKGLSLKQLSSVLGESEAALKMIESGELPGDYDKVINKIEQYFQVKLKRDEAEKEMARIDNAKMPAKVLKFDSETLGNITIDDLRKMKKAKDEAGKSDFEIAEVGRVGGESLIGCEVEIIDDSIVEKEESL